MNQTSMIEHITDNTLPHYEPYGWHRWPEASLDVLAIDERALRRRTLRPMG